MNKRRLAKYGTIIALTLGLFFIALYPAKTVHITQETVTMREEDAAVLDISYINITWTDSVLIYYMGDYNLDGKTIVYEQFR